MKSSYVLFLLAICLTANGAELNGRVVGITDGDTITILTDDRVNYKIRLAGIDAPEKKQDFGTVSKTSLSEMIYDKSVTVEWSKEDRYKRIIGKIIFNGKDINLEQVKRGLAWHYKKYQSEQSPEDQKRYSESETIAKSRKVGLWDNQNYIAPWDFRKHKKKNEL